MRCRHAEINDLSTLTEEQLRECNCDRCRPVADSKELERLRAEAQRRSAYEQAAREAQRIATEIAYERNRLAAEVGGILREEIERQLRAFGIDPYRDPWAAEALRRRISFPAVERLNARERAYTPEMQEFVKYLRYGVMGPGLLKAPLAEGTDSAGGVLVPEDFRAEVIRKLQAATVLRRAGARVVTTTRDVLNVPRVDAAGSGAWTAEGQPAPEATPQFGQVTFTPHPYARLVPVTKQLLADSAVDIVELLTDLFAEDFAVAEDRAFIDGSGTGQPKGIRQHNIAAVAAKNSGQAAGSKALTYDDLVELEAAVPRQYRSGAVFIASPKAIKILKRLKDSSGRPLWDPNLAQAGEPPRLLGYPVFESPAVPVNADGTTELLFGNPRFYWIVQREEMSIERSEHRYFEQRVVAFLGEMRVDGQLVVEEAWAKLTGFDS